MDNSELEIARLKNEISKTAESFEEKIKQIEHRAHETVEKIKATAHNLSLTTQIEKRPLVFLAGSLVTGILVGRKIFSTKKSQVLAVDSNLPEVEEEKPSILQPLALGIACTLLGNIGKRKLPEVEAYISAAQAAVVSEIGHSIGKRILS
jgi:hypothetical protein